MSTYQNYQDINSKIELCDFQKAIQIKSGKDTVICNWARNLGRSFTIMMTILKDKPESVLYFKSNNDYLDVLHYKYTEIIQKDYAIKNSINDYKKTKEKIQITYNNGSVTTIYNWYMLPIEYGVMQFDYIIFDSLLPTHLKDIYAKRIFSFITTNNYNHHLEKLFGDKTVVVLNEDYNTALKNGLTSTNLLEQARLRMTDKDWYNQYDILSKPVEEDKYKSIFDSVPDRKYELYFSYAVNDPSKRFIIDSLVGLEEEYDAIDKTKDTVLTRKNLLDMITQLQRELNR